MGRVQVAGDPVEELLEYRRRDAEVAVRAPELAEDGTVGAPRERLADPLPILVEFGFEPHRILA